MSITKPSSPANRVASFITIIAGCIVLAGWLFNISFLTDLIPGYGTMKLDTAFCFILSGIALYLLADGPSGSPSRKYAAFVCTSIVLVIAVLSLSQYLFTWNINIHQFF